MRIAEVLAVKDGERWPPMVDALSVPAGLETALGAALGEELTSAADTACGAALAGAATVRPRSQAAGLRRRRSQRWSRRRQPWPACFRRPGWWKTAPRRRGAGRTGARPGAGLARRRCLALGWLYDPSRHSDRGRRPAAAAQPVVAAAARPRRGARGSRSGARGSRHGCRRRPGGNGCRTAGPRGSGERRAEPGAGTRGRTSSFARSATEISARLAGIDTQIERLTAERDEAAAPSPTPARRTPHCPTWRRSAARSRRRVRR